MLNTLFKQFEASFINKLKGRFRDVYDRLAAVSKELADRKEEQ